MIRTFTMNCAGPNGRVPKGEIPSKNTLCDIEKCVYNKEGICDDPRCNKGNFDSTCHKMGNRILLVNHLTRIEP